MSFQNISKVELSQKMLDSAFKRATKVNSPRRGDDELRWAKKREAARLDAMNETIHGTLMRIIKEFPALDNLSEFYSELLKASLDFDKLKKGLGAVNWADNKAKALVIMHKKSIFISRSTESLTKLRRAYMGRISSVLKQIDENLKYLDQSRMIIKGFPIIKKLPTACISGFPNVGKSTLLGKITTSKPEIKAYAFTTKTLNLGYFETEHGSIQVIDTPGTLARPEKMNNIEKQAYLAIKYQADLIIYIFDPTHTYPVEDQEELLELVRKFRKPIIIYLSKTDLVKKENLSWLEKYDLVTSPIELKERIEKNFQNLLIINQEERLNQ
jgi:nucleolar GTP-binding protein